MVVAEPLPLVIDELRLPSVPAGDGVEPVVGDGFSVADNFCKACERELSTFGGFRWLGRYRGGYFICVGFISLSSVGFSVDGQTVDGFPGDGVKPNLGMTEGALFHHLLFAKPSSAGKLSDRRAKCITPIGALTNQNFFDVNPVIWF